MEVVKVLIYALWVIASVYACILLVDFIRTKKEGLVENEGSLAGLGIIGLVVNFFDTLGIGSFAPATALFRNYKLVKDKVIPGTLNVALCLPIIAQALIFMDSVKVDTLTLVTMIAAACLGSMIGAKHVISFSEKRIQQVMAVALLIVGLLILGGKLGIMPSGGTATGLTGIKLILGIVGNFILGILMTMGVGLYAPCMALVYALGMDPKSSFPIMMGSCAFLMPVASIKFIKSGAYNRRGSLLISITGVLGVIIAAYFVKTLEIALLMWIVLLAVIYTAVKLYFDSKKG